MKSSTSKILQAILGGIIFGLIIIAVIDATLDGISDLEHGNYAAGILGVIVLPIVVGSLWVAFRYGPRFYWEK